MDCAIASSVTASAEIGGSWRWRREGPFFTGIYNNSARRDFGKLLGADPPDLVHTNNLLPSISPSIFERDQALPHSRLGIWQIFSAKNSAVLARCAGFARRTVSSTLRITVTCLSKATSSITPQGAMRCACRPFSIARNGRAAAAAELLMCLAPPRRGRTSAGSPEVNSYGNLPSRIISPRRAAILQTGHRQQVTVLVSIALGAAALRAIWLLRPGEAWTMNADSVGYLALAHGLLHGCGFGVWMRGTCGPPEVLRTPGYPAFIALLGRNWRTVLFAQAIMGGLLVLALGLFAWRNFGFHAAVLAALLLATDVPTILASKELMTEASFQFVLGAGVLLLASAAFSKAEHHAALTEAATSGVLVAAASLIRPVGEILVPFLWLPFVLNTSAPLRRRICPGVTAVMASVIVLFCWALRNRVIADAWTLSTDGAFSAYYYAVPPLLNQEGQGSIAAIRHELVSHLRPSPKSYTADFPGSIGEPDYDSLLVTIEDRPRLGSSMYRVFADAARRRPLVEATICAEGLVRLAFQPYSPGIGLQGLMRGESGASTLPVSYDQRSTFRVIVSATVAFQALWLTLAWSGALMALGRAWRCGRNGYLALVTALWVFTMLLLAAPTPFFGAWDLRYRTPAVPFLALLAGMGWFSAAASDSSDQEPFQE